MVRNKKIIAMVVITVAVVTSSFAYVYLTREPNRLIVSTTTSLYDTGLLDVMGANYLNSTFIKLDFLAAGTGQALEHARRGDADVVLVHAPSTENQFLSEGVVGARKIIAYNFYVIAGPKEDPAGIKELSPIEALKKIAAAGATWISRGDNSGTHTKEKSLWKSAGITTSGKAWYAESGSGMGQTLTIASERRAYTLSDTGTYLKFQTDKLIDLEILVDKTRDLLNVYSVMAVSPEKNPNVKFNDAIKFIEYLVSEVGQKMLGGYGMDKYGVSLFTPAVKLLQANSDPTMASWIRGYAFLDNSECPPKWRLGQEQLYR